MLTSPAWSDFVERSLPAEIRQPIALSLLGRIAADYGTGYVLYTELGERRAEIGGALRTSIHGSNSFLSDRPAVGDWVRYRSSQEDPLIIEDILPRKSKFSRKVASTKTQEQAIATNIDYVFLMMGMDHDFNLRRLERYLILAWESGAIPVILLNKIDRCDDVNAVCLAIEAIAPGVPILPISATQNQGLEQLQPYLQIGYTIALVGSSGVGKSTLTNYLIGENKQLTQAVRQQDSHGRHTTTHRQLFFTQSGALILDSPGLRELQLWATPDALHHTFADIDALAKNCRFRDCCHDTEPGCAVQGAIATGDLDPVRLVSYRKLQNELTYLERRQDERSSNNTKKRWKAIHKSMRHHPKQRLHEN